MAESIERLSFELTSGALMEQERAVSSMRACTGIVLSAASIAGSFLGSRVRGGSLDAWSVLATLSFVLCFGSAITVLLPRALTLSIVGDDLLAEGDCGGRIDVNEGYRAACGWIATAVAVNRRRIDRLAGWLTLSCILLALEVVLLTVSVAS
ncbi:MAG TPA: hypothetical protein VGF47_09475 [Solirubrobacteraceae bacterium]|jgi:hypothetical protein